MVGKQDQDLVKRISQGDPTAENELFSRFGERIARHVQFNIRENCEDWRDVVSDVNMSILLNLRQGKFKLDGEGSLATYIYAITRNHIRTYFKIGRRKRTVEDNSLQANIDCQDESELETKESDKALEQLLSKLKLKYQQVLYLKFYEGMTVREISKEIDLPPRRVSERINYALKLLRKECAERGFFQYLLTFL